MFDFNRMYDTDFCSEKEAASFADLLGKKQGVKVMFLRMVFVGNHKICLRFERKVSPMEKFPRIVTKGDWHKKSAILFMEEIRRTS